ncbi:hypothetical protein KQX54_009781 [Cotesia glomerata]|uniref:Uncharacterized protein n=1 Tax=Cotesia glomerata TaxID=32391 RepID=A0AAV7HWC0_COTGL|nr:hypothetical protein KQX54_009781 [Cotesia glomerata]
MALGPVRMKSFGWTVYLGGLYFAFVGAETKDRMSGSLQRQLRELTYPDDSEMGLFFALAIPLDDPVATKAMSVAFFFEANYGLVRDQESLASRARKQRAAFSDHKLLTRATVYSILESKFEALSIQTGDSNQYLPAPALLLDILIPWPFSKTFFTQPPGFLPDQTLSLVLGNC